MDAHERELFVAALRKALEAGQGLEEVGWYDALADDRRTAVSTLFGLQGEHNATSPALDAVVTTALGLPPGRLVLPVIGGYAAPGLIERDLVRVRGLCLGSGFDKVHAVTPDGSVTLSVDNLQFVPVTGMDPALGLVAVSGDVT